MGWPGGLPSDDRRERDILVIVVLGFNLSKRSNLFWHWRWWQRLSPPFGAVNGG